MGRASDVKRELACRDVEALIRVVFRYLRLVHVAVLRHAVTGLRLLCGDEDSVIYTRFGREPNTDRAARHPADPTVVRPPAAYFRFARTCVAEPLALEEPGDPRVVDERDRGAALHLQQYRAGPPEVDLREGRCLQPPRARRAHLDAAVLAPGRERHARHHGWPLRRSASRLSSLARERPGTSARSRRPLNGGQAV